MIRCGGHAGQRAEDDWPQVGGQGGTLVRIVETTGDEWRLTAVLLPAGDDLLILVTGGEKPHLGAVAAAAPRPSLDDPARMSATASVLCYLGHKEDEIAKYLSERLSAALECKVIVAAGMHWDGLTAEGLTAVRSNTERLIDAILKALDE